MLALVLPLYIKWHLVIAPKAIIEGWKNILWFTFSYFSVPLLLQTLFTPWKGIRWEKKRGFHIEDFFFILASNLLSRMLGALVRIPLILVGIIGEILVFGLGIIVLFVWFLLPVFILLSFIYGIRLLF
ncbi:hypothetical protein IID24_00835 [Patescibacteria group bacterium]|nr:hypothetical protein [Patescibacteria group bacterium]